MTDDTILLGAVAYDPKVIAIWEGIRSHFRAVGVSMDFTLFSNYERQVEALVAGFIDIAWNTPLAHLRVQRRTRERCRSLGMRDTDRDFRTRLVVRRDAGIRGPVDLIGRRLAVGSRDSTQARILPLHFFAAEGVSLERVTLVPFDSDVGKHGDTGRSEFEVLDALKRGEADAGVVCELMWVWQQSSGRIDPGQLEAVWTSPAFDHCIFDAGAACPAEKCDAFGRALFAMRWDDPAHRRLLELEGLKEWMPPRESGYDSLRAALDAQGGW